MYEDRWLDDVSGAIEIGGVADALVLVLARRQNNPTEPLQSEDKEALAKGLQFLNRAREGLSWLDEQPRVSADSRSFVNPFSVAVRSLPDRVTTTEFAEQLDGMVAALQGLLAGKTENPGLPPARTFFGRVASASTDSITDALRKRTMGPGSWNPAFVYSR